MVQPFIPEGIIIHEITLSRDSGAQLKNIKGITGEQIEVHEKRKQVMKKKLLIGSIKVKV